MTRSSLRRALLASTLASFSLVPPAALAGNDLTQVQVLRDGVGGVDGLAGATAIALAPDGTNAYATGSLDDALVVFDRDAVTGMLTPTATLRDGVGGVDGLGRARAVTVSPDGTGVYVASGGGALPPAADDAVAEFRRDLATGALTFIGVARQGVGGVDGLAGATALAFSPDGTDLYVASERPGALAVFHRDGASGALAFVEVHGPATAGLAGADAVLVSPEGTNVYAVGAGDAAVAGFARNVATGELTALASTKQAHLATPGALVLSADGESFYVGSTNTGALVAFERDPATGILHFDKAIAASPTWFGQPLGLVVAPDGHYVYDADAAGALVITRRDLSNGDLGIVGRKSNGVDGVDGMMGATGVAVSADNRYVYVAAQEGTVSVFTRRTVCSATRLAGCRHSVRAGGGSLNLTKAFIDDRDIVTWKWLSGAATPAATFGDPITATDYSLCVYDASAAAQPVDSLLAPAGGVCRKGKPCWATKGAGGFKYSDLDKTPDGLFQVVLLPGVDGKAQITVRGSYGSLPYLQLPLTAPVTVQLQAGNGACWESVFSAPSVTTSVHFVGRSD